MKLLLLSCQCLKNRTFLKIVPNHHNNRVQNLHFASIFLQKWGSTKKHRAIPVGHYLKEMADPKTEAVLAPLRALVSKQGDIVKQLKATGAPDLDVKQAVANLKLLKKDLEDKELSLVPNLASFDRDKLEDLLKRRFSHDQSFSIQGGVAGQYDFGPIGCAFKRNLLENWLHFFVYEEDMLEVDCSILTPEAVLKASGHVDRFSDLLVKDVKTGDHFRLDHLIKEHLENIISDKKTPENIKDECKTVMIKLDGLNKDELHELLRKYDMKSESGNELSEPIDFNLMFGTQIGPSGDIKGYLRPETAQGIFVNFKRLLEYNRGRLPFAAAQIGTAFRNEISPRSGLLRVREFTMAEIEHFCDPDKKTHLKFKDVQNTELLLYSACNQMTGKSAERKTIGDAVREGLVNNETLGYFIARIQQYLIQSGVDPQRLRFRQHMGNEMAHYAQDCWDAECLTSYGWIECVGCADRSGFDLTQHTEATGVRLVAKRKLLQPRTVDIVEVVSNKGLEGTFKKDVKCITDALATLKLNEIDGLEKSLKDKGWYELIIGSNSFNLTKEMISVQRSQKLQHTEEITPNVIEPSFGIGRIMYSIFEHNFRMRDNNEHRTYLSLPANVAPFKCSVLPLSNKAEFQPFVNKLSKDLTKVRVSHIVDDSSGSIGRRYARTDEIAIPYGITIDFDTLKEPHSVTLRERDTMSQVRIPLTELSTVVHNLSYSKIMWEEVKNKYPKFEQQQLGVNVIEQDDIVRQLKGLDLDAKQTVPEARFENKELNLVSFDLAKMKDLIERTFFYAESYSVYSGITGQYDFGPMGCALKRNLLQNWLQFFVREEKMLEVDCSILTPESVLKTSGHVDHFSDLITKDVNTGECFNWNHFTKAHLENIILDKKTPEKMRAECKNIIIMLDGLNKDELNERLRKYNVKNMNGNELSEPNEFNLMFGTQIGPSGLIKGYLRPETAQGIFVNFKRLLEFNQDRLPFAAAQIGTVFRNEITPSSGLIRVREFTMADIEHFCDPQNMAHLKFEDVRNTELLLYSASDQINGKSAEWKTIGDAVRDGLVDNETLGYFIARIQQFLIQSGVDPQRLRFRQHMGNEKAHYAQDSWDAECLTSYGWINCVGIADRSTFDLTQHAKATGVRLVAEKRLHEPRIVDVVEAVSNKVLLGKTFKKEMKIITDALADLKLNEIEVLEKSLKDKGSCELIVGNHTFKLTKEMISVKRSKKTEYTEEITPNVIGSSFGVGRIMHVIFEHNFRVRENQRSTYFSLPTSVAPRKCSILPVSDNAELQSLVNQLSNDLATVGVSRMVDCSSEPIGMRYARSDEFGIPYVITIDFDSLKQPHSVILRERDSMSQVRIPLTELSTVIHNLSHGEIIWKEVENNYPKFEQQENKRIEVHAV